MRLGAYLAIFDLIFSIDPKKKKKGGGGGEGGRGGGRERGGGGGGGGEKEDAPGGVRTGEGCDAGEQVVWECGLRFTGWVVM